MRGRVGSCTIEGWSLDAQRVTREADARCGACDRHVIRSIRWLERDRSQSQLPGLTDRISQTSFSRSDVAVALYPVPYAVVIVKQLQQENVVQVVDLHGSPELVLWVRVFVYSSGNGVRGCETMTAFGNPMSSGPCIIRHADCITHQYSSPFVLAKRIQNHALILIHSSIRGKV